MQSCVISALSRSCPYHLRDFRRIRLTLDFHTANIIATLLLHSFNPNSTTAIPSTSTYWPITSTFNKLQVIQNSMGRAITSKRKFDHISPTLRSLHWLKIKERINYKIISLTYRLYNLANCITCVTYSAICSLHKIWLIPNTFTTSSF